jgi:hypothetical protein
MAEICGSTARYFGLSTLAMAGLGLWLAAGCGDDDSGSADAGALMDADLDSGPASDADPGTDAAFQCSAEICDSEREFCYQFGAGVGGAAAAPAEVGCNPLPDECLAMPSCDCLRAHAEHDCPIEPWCEEDGDRVTLSCFLP